MRHSFKGAAALAALCAGSLAFGSAATAFAYVPGASGNTADVARIAGIDRTQTALEASTAAPREGKAIDKFFIVGYNGQVDALTLAPWNCNDNGYVIYARGGSLEERNLKVLKANPNAEVYIIGGTKAVSAGVENQLRQMHRKDGKFSYLTRVSGADRYSTAYHVGGFILDRCDMTVRYQDVTGHKAAVDAANLAIADYNAALARYQAAVKANDAAIAALAKATEARDAAFEALVKASSKHIDTDAIEKALKKAQNQAKAAVLDADANIALVSVIFHGLATTDFNLPDDENVVTLQDFLDAPADTPAKQEAIAKLKAVLADSATFNGIVASDTLNVAIDKAKKAVANFEAQKAQAALLVGKVYDKWLALVNAQANNEAILKEVAEAYRNYQSAEAARAAAEKAAKAAAKELNQAINQLAKLTKPYLKALRDLPGLINAYEAAIAKTYKGSEAVTFVSTGVNFADALAAGPAAAKQDGIVLLTKGEAVPAITKKALDLSKAQTVAIGGPAARAMKKAFSQSAVEVYGKDRYATAVEVAKRYFADGAASSPYKGLYALASGENPADAVVAGAYLTSQGEWHAAILLTKKNSLPKVTADFLSYGTTGSNQTWPYVDSIAVFGGNNAISKAVVEEARDAANLK